jgi:DNA-binding transcriptional ArsR family regulator
MDQDPLLTGVIIFASNSQLQLKIGLPNGIALAIVLQMENYLDAAFHALADPTRRAVISRLTRGPAPVKELAEPFAMGLPAFLKHLRILEADGLIRSEKVGRVRTCRVDAERLAAAESWLGEQRRQWQAQADRLAAYVETAMEHDDET